METLTFTPIAPEDYDAVERMIIDFYSEGGDDPGNPFMTDSKVRKTIAQTLSHPDHLKIIVFREASLSEEPGKPVGYSILSAFWSNEYGGLVMIIDELYVVPAFRGKGVSTHFIRQLAEAREYVALNLEVFHENTRAFELYKRLGFEVIERHFMQKPL
jgi:ribosomal protein S18 acetylase RimI-like enzyme